MACVYIPVQNSEEEVRVSLDQLPRDASDILDILKAEQAPLDLWLIIAVCSVFFYFLFSMLASFCIAIARYQFHQIKIIGVVIRVTQKIPVWIWYIYIFAHVFAHFSCARRIQIFWGTVWWKQIVKYCQGGQLTVSLIGGVESQGKNGMVI